MNHQFLSDHQQRLQLLEQLQPPSLNGIRYLEVLTKDQLSLKLVFVHPLAALGVEHLRIEGGVRIRGIRIETVSVNGHELRLTVDRAGDFSWYQLLLVNPAAPDEPPAGFDPCLAAIRFSFKAQCPSEFDCQAVCRAEGPLAAEPLLDYLAKDYASFRRLMFDRMGQLLPHFDSRHPADFGVALVELLAHVGDQLSYYQDAVATEAYLGTARRRISLRRHARLLDYPVHDGCNSRVYIALGVDAGADGVVLAAASRFLTASAEARAELVVSPARLEQLAASDNPEVEVFESLHPLQLRAAHNEIAIHNWGNPRFCLPANSLSAALVDNGLQLQPGMVLLLEEIASPLTGLAADARRQQRHAVRLTAVRAAQDEVTNTPLLLVTWHSEDALPWPLTVSAEISQGGLMVAARISVARANVLLADHGLSRALQPLLPELASSGRYRPRLQQQGLAFAEPYDHQQALAAAWSARRALAQQPQRALPAQMSLVEDDSQLQGEQPAPAASPWRPQRDLLASDRFAQEFVVEVEADGLVYLRFGDGRNGRQPEAGSRLLASYRQGGGSRGNVGSEAICQLVSADPAVRPFVRWLRNPMPAVGGVDGESRDAIRLQAPEGFRQQQRAVTVDDYARAAERHAGVQRAAARLRWTGSWHTLYLSVDRKGGLALDEPFKRELLAHLEPLRLAGYDLELNEPQFVALDIELAVCVLPGYFAASVKAALLARLANGHDERGQAAFFHPDHFSFGQGLALSALLQACHAISGVASVTVNRFQRWGKTANGELQAGWLAAAPLEVLRLDNDPNFPENGRMRLQMRGGL